jgi:hypothetical protein
VRDAAGSSARGWNLDQCADSPSATVDLKHRTARSPRPFPGIRASRFVAARKIERERTFG